MVRTLILFSCLFCLSARGDWVEAPTTGEAWDREPTAVKYDGRDAFILQGGGYQLKDVSLTNGRIAVDIFTPGQRGFVGLLFRQFTDNDAEVFYFRPHKSRLPDTIQYTPVFNGLTGWQLYYDERYLATAEIPTDRWVTYELEFIGKQLKIFVDGEKEPVLTTIMKHDVVEGGIGMWGNTAGIFSNFRYQDLGDDAPSYKAEPQILEPGIIEHWQVSQRYTAKDQPANNIPKDIVWQNAEIEDLGFVNVSRHHPRGDSKALAYAKTTITADKAKRVKLWFGYSDEIAIFLNGNIQYEGNNTYNFRAPYALGLLDIDNEGIYLDLEKGDNELVFAVSETFGGWGFVGRIEE